MSKEIKKPKKPAWMCSVNVKSTSTVNITFTDGCKKYIELQSGRSRFYTNMPEVRYIEQGLEVLRPRRVVDLGSGIGRASVYLAKLFGWTDTTTFYLYDGDSGETTHYGPARENLNEFYNSETEAKLFCKANGLKRVVFVNAEITRLDKLPKNIDLFYSFLAFGFHWSIHHVLPVIHRKLRPGGYVIFGTQGTDKEDGETFTNAQINRIDLSKWNVVQNERRPHLERSSVLVLEKIE